jgi:hypothetical protein
MTYYTPIYLKSQVVSLFTPIIPKKKDGLSAAFLQGWGGTCGEKIE